MPVTTACQEDGKLSEIKNSINCSDVFRAWYYSIHRYTMNTQVFVQGSGVLIAGGVERHYYYYSQLLID